MSQPISFKTVIPSMSIAVQDDKKWFFTKEHGDCPENTCPVSLTRTTIDRVLDDYGLKNLIANPQGTEPDWAYEVYAKLGMI